jgi:REP element-mobilizing transposase RayT
MTNYRRGFVPGGSYFFTLNLAERRLRLLTEHIGLLRTAFPQYAGTASGGDTKDQGVGFGER